MNRRQLLRAGMFGSLGMLAAACSPQTTQPAAAPAQAQPASGEATGKPIQTPAAPAAPAPAATATRAPAVAATAAEPPAAPASNITATEVASSPAEKPAAVNTALIAGMTSSANDFLNGLSDAQRSTAAFAMTDAERLRWHWTTTNNFPRNGLRLRDMEPKQREAALALLRSGVSEAGFKKSMDIMQLQPEISGDPDNYFVSVFGAPGDASWGWRFEGHHLSRHFTIAGDKVAITPFFHGVWPSVSDAGKAIMRREEWAARELVTSLSDSLRATVVFQSRALTQHVTWNQNYVTPLEPVGAALAEFNTDQQALAMEIIQTWMDTQAEPVAQAHLARINSAGLDNIRFGWAGTLQERRPHYYRIQGPSFLLEYDNTRGGGIHIHSVWRVFDQDFGQGLTG